MQARGEEAVSRGGGLHLLIDLTAAQGLDDPERVRRALVDAADACGATLVHVAHHEFAPASGVTAVALLAESHIAIHTWPEEGYAAVDVFVCGSCDPYRILPVLEEAFRPGGVQVTARRRAAPVPARDAARSGIRSERSPSTAGAGCGAAEPREG